MPLAILIKHVFAGGYCVYSKIAIHALTIIAAAGVKIQQEECRKCDSHTVSHTIAGNLLEFASVIIAYFAWELVQDRMAQKCSSL